VLVRVRAYGICGIDAAFADGRHPPGPEGQAAATPLGHDPAGEVAAGAEVTGLKAGDRVVVNPFTTSWC
jgi:(R,R)-butanediol dehydrogenase/meso-butanediol dehydrogenase/diacetyl reductase